MGSITGMKLLQGCGELSRFLSPLLLHFLCAATAHFWPPLIGKAENYPEVEQASWARDFFALDW